MANEEIRRAIKSANLTQWEVADYLSISEITLCRRLRKELDKNDKDKILEIISKHKKLKKQRRK